jgi:hypothetical protein
MASSMISICARPWFSYHSNTTYEFWALVCHFFRCPIIWITVKVMSLAHGIQRS